MCLARTYWGIPSSFFEIGVKYSPRACGPQAILNPNFSEFRWYSPIRPCQTHSIPSTHIAAKYRLEFSLWSKKVNWYQLFANEIFHTSNLGVLKSISFKTWRASFPATFGHYSANRVIAGVSLIQINLKSNADPVGVINDQWRAYHSKVKHICLEKMLLERKHIRSWPI